jgi:hypothetical protein
MATTFIANDGYGMYKAGPAGTPIAPSVIRGKVIADSLVEFGGRNGAIKFLAPDPHKIVEMLSVKDPTKMADLYSISLDEIVEYLVALGDALALKKNARMQEACELSYYTAPTTPPLLKRQFEEIDQVFSRISLEETIDSVGRAYLEGWVERRMQGGKVAHIRAFGARALHIIAGNGPALAAVTIIRNAITRSDAIIKAPSNDPFTAGAIARTMVDMAPDHPITKHLAVAYWKGGDQEVEQQLYQPQNVEKIVAWGGFASVKHVTRYIQPGLELISLDPKRSISIVGPEAFENDASLDEAAQRVASDVGCHNQEGCVNARVLYVCSGTDDNGIARLEKLGERVYEKMMQLPALVSTPPKGGINPELKSHLTATSVNDEWFRVIGGDHDEGAVIISKLSEPVDFAPSLTNRVANLVPLDEPEDMLPRVDAYCQTVGVYPESLVMKLRDKLSVHGAQRIVSLGYAVSANVALPQDALEVLRRMCKWIVNEYSKPDTVLPPWLGGGLFSSRPE